MTGEVVHCNLGAKLVETELGGERRSETRRTIEQKPAAMAGRRFGHQEICDDLALGSEQCAEFGDAGLYVGNLSGQKVVEKAPCIVADHLDDAAIGEKRCLHLLALVNEP